MRISTIALLAGAAALGLSSAVSAQTIKIGFHAPLTGFAAADGKSAVHGAQLAIDQINAKGGVMGKKLELKNL